MLRRAAALPRPRRQGARGARDPEPGRPCRVCNPSPPPIRSRGIALGLWIARPAVVLTVTKAKGTSAALTSASSPNPLLTRRLKRHSGDNTVKVKKLAHGKRLAAGRYRLTFVEIYKGKHSRKVSQVITVKR